MSAISGVPGSRVGGRDLFSTKLSIAGDSPRLTDKQKETGQSFYRIFEKAMQVSGFDGLQKFEKKVGGGAQFSAAELINFQIKAGEFQLQLEFLSKVADSAAAGIRKLQSSQ